METKYNDKELVILLSSGSQNAFSYLYDNYAGALNGVIYRIVKENMLAEDILQEVFVKAWANFHQFDTEKGRLFTWLVNIARNHTIDTLRSKSYKNNKNTNLGDPNHNQDRIYRDDLYDGIGLRKQLSLLKPAHKNVLDLAYFMGFTQAEIAKEIGIPLGTVKTRLRTAIMELKTVMNEPVLASQVEAGNS